MLELSKIVFCLAQLDFDQVYFYKAIERLRSLKDNAVLMRVVDVDCAFELGRYGERNQMTSIGNQWHCLMTKRNG